MHTSTTKIVYKKHPLMYNGWLIKRCGNGKLSAYDFKTNYFINPLYNTWEQLKSVIDATKPVYII